MVGAPPCACPLSLPGAVPASIYAAVCTYSWLTSFKVDNLCTASTPTTSGYGCWLPLHSSDTQLLPGPTDPAGVAVSLVSKNVYAAYYALDVAPTTQIGKTSIEVRGQENGCFGGQIPCSRRPSPWKRLMHPFPATAQIRATDGSADAKYANLDPSALYSTAITAAVRVWREAWHCAALQLGADSGNKGDASLVPSPPPLIAVAFLHQRPRPRRRVASQGAEQRRGRDAGNPARRLLAGQNQNVHPRWTLLQRRSPGKRQGGLTWAQGRRQGMGKPLHACTAPNRSGVGKVPAGADVDGGHHGRAVFPSLWCPCVRHEVRGML